MKVRDTQRDTQRERGVIMAGTTDNRKNEDVFKSARSLLATFHKQGRKEIFEDPAQTAEALACTVSLIRSFNKASMGAAEQQGPFSPDWKVIRAVLELLVRLGISPNLGPGVGVARAKQPMSAGFLAAASAVANHLSELGIAGLSSVGPSENAPPSGSIQNASPPHDTILFTCVEVLSSLIWVENYNRDIEVCDLVRDLAGNTPAIPPMGQLVVSSFLWDVMAAYMQLGFGPRCDEHLYKQISIERIEKMVMELPVRDMVEASFMLLHRTSPVPPVWLKTQLGKQLSTLLMRQGGVAVVMEELVGHASKGNVELYDKIASHLAKVPRLVATSEEYFRAVCPQLLPLLLLYSQSTSPQLGETARTTMRNIHFTAVSLAFKFSFMEPSLVEEYLLQPLLQPLMNWINSQRLEHVSRKEDTVDSWDVTEKEVVDSVVQVSTLLTSGHQDGSSLRDFILKETRSMMPLLMKLHYQLEAAVDFKSLRVGNRLLNVNTELQSSMAKNYGGTVPSSKTVRSKGIAKGFLNKGLGIEDASEEDHESTASRLRIALSDLVMAQVTLPVDIALPFTASLFFKYHQSVLGWPEKQSEVWDILNNPGSTQPNSVAMYFSRALRLVENWPLLVALMNKLLQKILELRQCISTGRPVGAELLRYMEDFEVLNNEIGIAALEGDIVGAALLVTALLADQTIVKDEDILELVLNMVHRVLTGFRSSKESDTNEKFALPLTDMTSLLERLYSNASLGEKLRQMSFTLAQECSYLNKP